MLWMEVFLSMFLIFGNCVGFLCGSHLPVLLNQFIRATKRGVLACCVTCVLYVVFAGCLVIIVGCSLGIWYSLLFPQKISGACGKVFLLLFFFNSSISLIPIFSLFKTA